ncbi:MAG TPA: ferredoxin [Longimicrobiales bacterium]|nr:ferredoxin [Longimicrobiales bacterium]
MEPFAERRIGDLVVRIDRRSCLAYGDCIDMAPQVFELDEDGICRFREPIGEIEREPLILACDVCPAQALLVFDGDGRQLV